MNPFLSLKSSMALMYLVGGGELRSISKCKYFYSSLALFIALLRYLSYVALSTSHWFVHLVP